MRLATKAGGLYGVGTVPVTPRGGRQPARHRPCPECGARAHAPCQRLRVSKLDGIKWWDQMKAHHKGR